MDAPETQAHGQLAKLEHNALTWMLSVNGFIADIRHMPRDVQEEAFHKGRTGIRDWGLGIGIRIRIRNIAL